MSFTPYLNFDGTCAEAMMFYAEVFGADDLMIMRFGDAPAEAEMPPADPNLVMHSQFTMNGKTLMASDAPGDFYRPQQGVSVMHEVPDVAAGRALFDKLLEGGEVTMPYEPVFFSPAFGMLKDRFGTHWMIAVTQEN